MKVFKVLVYIAIIMFVMGTYSFSIYSPIWLLIMSWVTVCSWFAFLSYFKKPTVNEKEDWLFLGIRFLIYLYVIVIYFGTIPGEELWDWIQWVNYILIFGCLFLVPRVSDFRL